jgi:[protein-PII] uridylyltransferase
MATAASLGPGPVADPAAVVADLTAARGSLHTAGPDPGRAWCEAWSDHLDAALQRLAAPVLETQRLTVAAVGGYGRREPCPASDVDLLLLHDGAEAPALEHAVRSIVYPLWDAGLTVGYAVRDRREALAAVDDVGSATATLDLRHVAGEVGLGQLVRAEVTRRLRRRPHRFLAALSRADADRRERVGDAAEVLEPNLKDGAGGLRDLHSLRWAAGALVGTVGLDPLVPAGYLGASDRPRLVQAEEELLAARVALHLVAGKTDVLRLDRQDAVAARLGEADAGPHDLAPHRLLGRLYLAARTVAHAHQRAWALIDADVARGARRRGRPTEQRVAGFELVDGVLRVPVAEDVDAPDLPVRLLEALVASGAVLDRGSAARLRRRAETAVAAGPVAGAGPAPAGVVVAGTGPDEPTDPGPRWGWDAAIRDRFLGVLWRGRLALPALAELDEVGVLGAWLPEWAPLRGRPQRNPYHRFALDRHGWHTVAELAELVRTEPWAARALEAVGDRDALLLAALLHDVGKLVGEPHEETGIPLAAAIARRMAATPGTIALLERSVRWHLLLPDTARRRDVTDPALAEELAGLIGDHPTLAGLHLLAVADARATGPTAWNDWIGSLVATLVRRVSAVLDEQSPEEIAGGRHATAVEAERLAPELGASAELVRDHLQRLPDRYAEALTPRAVVRHALMATSRPGPADVRTRVTRGEDDPDGATGVDVLDVVAEDHPGWFAKVAGVVALEGGSIVAADAFTRDDGLSVDTFRVRPPEGAGSSWWARIEGDLHEAAAGKLAIRARVARKARSEAHRLARLPEVATAVTAAPDPSGRATVVEVRTLDRLGVLYAIAAALGELQLDIVVARVQTIGHEVVDVFYVQDATGRPLDDDHVAELDLAVTAALEPR